MQVNDYVRTKDYLGIQLICKIDKILHKYAINTDKGYWDTEHIIKSSPNIIDLIEVGDYVNGERVIYINKKYKYLEVSDEEIIIKEKDIKSILTKEQFERCEYKI